MPNIEIRYILAQKNYKPNAGWLELIIAGLLYYEVFNDTNYTESFPKILKSLQTLKADCAGEPVDETENIPEYSRSSISSHLDSIMELSGYFSGGSRRNSAAITELPRNNKCIIS